MATKASSIPEYLPQSGGSYTRNPDTGELIPNTPPAEAAIPVDPSAVAGGEGTGSSPAQE